MPLKYVHTNIIAANWRVLARFYQTVFSCTPVPPQRHQQGDWLAQGTGIPEAELHGIHLRLPGHGPDGPTLEIYQYRHMPSKPPAMANRLGYGHLAFQVDDVAETQALVIQHGGRTAGRISETFVDGVGRLKFVYLCDPEDNLLEIQHWS